MTKQIQSIQQKQHLTMTTTMHQSISILQMSNTELIEFAAQELGKNPFIEDDNIILGNNQKNSENKEKLTQPYTGIPGITGAKHSNQNFLSNIAGKKSLKEYLSEQINISFNSYKEKLIAYFLLDYLQASGYLGISVAEAANILKCQQHLVMKVLKQLQTFDPVGIFARDLRECLIIQLKERNDLEQPLQTMVENLDLVASGDLEKLSKLCKVDIDHVSNMIRKIKSLNPKPANGFFVEEIRYKIPDVTLTIDKYGRAKLETNQESMPNLKVNNDYYAIVKDNFMKKGEKEFAKAEIEAANVIVKSIAQRSNTILQVAASIVEQQIEFFTRGIMHLKPMTLNKIAAITGFNESTISRSTSNKYIATPSGIYELKYFFSSGLGTSKSSGDNISSTKVKELLRQIIISEESNNIFSDDDISKQLNKFNINIARRTVTKYRESLGIPASTLRKRARYIASV
jgi:RNA polymerase sigma-54 factor